MIPSFKHQPSHIECPYCPRCRTRMTLAHIIQISSISEKRLFDCPHCKFVEMQIAAQSDALVGLANSIRQPT